jgi:DNA helicase-2/ATP-dependent DNA helicase PcrA
MASYNTSFDRLNEAQKRAVTTIEGPVLVIAGPGTGKTQLLTTRIAHILATTDTLPQNILCLTFTDSAAQTMRERLATMIGQSAYDVTISTYHAFGSELIRRFPDYFTNDAELQPVDDLGIDRILRSIINDLPYGNPLKFSDAYLSDIRTVISDAKRAVLTPEELRAIAQANLQFIQQANPMVAESLRSFTRMTIPAVPSFVGIGEGLVPYLEVGTNYPTPSVYPLAKPMYDTLQAALAEFEETHKTTPLTKWKNTWLARDATGKFVIDGQKTNEKLLAVADIYEQYLAALHESHLFDYDDMILRAVRALEQNDDMRFTLQEQYLYLLLDEFQDTNGAQLRLVELLTDNPVNEGRPNVLAVGDDDQAIYAFQGADYSHMLQFTAMYRDVLPIALTENYRSHADILHTARGIAEQIEQRLHHHFPGIEKELTAASSELPEHAVIERREARSDIMQFAWVTQRIRQLIDNGTPAHEIAVLAPQHKYLEPLVAFLQEADIAVRYDKRENVLDDPAVNQLLRMSELCLALARGDQQTADALWAEVLSFEFWGLPTSMIWRLSWQATDDDRNWTAELLDDEQLKPIALFFIRLSQISSTETLETMLDYLIGSTPLQLNEPGFESFTSPYYSHYFGDIDISERESAADEAITNAAFWDLLSDLIVLRGRLHDYRRESTERLGLADFLEFVEAHRAAELKILNTSPYATGTDAVQLMTAFKSKGMEFEAVFVLAVNDQAWGTSARGAGSRLSLPNNLAFIRYGGATNDERLRLFYVAITRAKQHLYLVSYSHTYTGKATSHLRYLNETTDENGAMYSPLLPDADQLIRYIDDGLATPTTELSAYWQQRHEHALTSAELRTLLADRLKQYQLSPTHLCDFIDIVNSGPKTFFLKTILRFPQTPHIEAQFGNAMHETLEWLHHATKQGGITPNNATIHKRFEQQLRAKRLSEHDTNLYLQRGTAALSAYVTQRAHTIAPGNVVEYSFRNEGVFVGDAHLAGKIDKLIIDKEQKTIVVVDYKTGKSYQRWSHEVKLHKYKHQLYIYKLLVEGSHRFKGYTVTDAYLEFVEPDEDGVIQELHLAFDESEIKHTRALIQAMWQRLQSLDLPDVSSYDATLGGIQAFEKDLTS